jgi:hypothetical protein
MKTCSQVELIVMRGLLCKLDCPDFQHIGQFGTDEEVIDMSDRVVLSGQALFDGKAPMGREVNC